tara:strand:- start:1475 stop:1744 length:270 start_codon:yes stop_codon:yes gene_type:complete
MIKKEEVTTHRKLKLNPAMFVPHNIQTLMYAYQRKVDISLKNQSIVDKMDNDDLKYENAYRDLVNSQIDCITLDKKLNRLIQELDYKIN